MITLKKPIRLIALDLDGTTFNESKEITPAVYSAIEQALAQGVIVMPATGRPQAGLPETFLNISGVTYALTSNGARIVDLQTNQSVYTDHLPLADGIKVMDYMAQYGYVPDIYIDGAVFVERDAYEQVLKTFDLGSLLPYFMRSRHPVEHLRSYVLEQGKDLEKINLMIQDQPLRRQMMEHLQTEASFSVSAGLSTNIEVTSATVNKGTALLNFGKQLGISREEIMACGDGGNDLDMIKAAGLGVAMGNAAKEIKAAADYITESNEKDGVALAIQKFVLHS